MLLKKIFNSGGIMTSPIIKIKTNTFKKLRKAGTSLHVSLMLSIALEKLQTNELYALSTVDFENYNKHNNM